MCEKTTKLLVDDLLVVLREDSNCVLDRIFENIDYFSVVFKQNDNNFAEYSDVFMIKINLLKSYLRKFGLNHKYLENTIKQFITQFEDKIYRNSKQNNDLNSNNPKTELLTSKRKPLSEESVETRTKSRKLSQTSGEELTKTIVQKSTKLSEKTPNFNPKTELSTTNPKPLSEDLMKTCNKSPNSAKTSSKTAPNFECNECKLCFESALNLELHDNRDHRNVESFICHECKRVFDSKVVFLRHLSSKHKNPVFGCDLCDYKSYNEHNLFAHKSTHSNRRPFRCDVDACNRKFKTRIGLKAHQKVVHSVKLFVCEYPKCGQRFRNVFKLKTHRKSHSIIKPFSYYKRTDYKQRLINETIGSYTGFNVKSELSAKPVETNSVQIKPKRGRPPKKNRNPVLKSGDDLKRGRGRPKKIFVNDSISDINSLKTNPDFSLITELFKDANQSRDMNQTTNKLSESNDKYNRNKIKQMFETIKSKTNVKTNTDPEKRAKTIHKTYHTNDCRESKPKIANNELLVNRLLSDEASDVFECDLCDYRTLSKSDLIQHKSTHFSVTYFRCGNNGCDESFQTQMGRSQHRKHCLSIEQFRCDRPMCQKTFWNQSDLRRHIERHGWDELSDSSLDYSNNFVQNIEQNLNLDFVNIRHELIPKKENISELITETTTRIDSETDSNASDTENSIKVEVIDKTTESLMCFETNVNESNNSLITQNTIKAEPNEPQVMPICEDCGEPFESEMDLKQHFDRVHKRLKTRVECNECNHIFDNKELLLRHMTTTHKKTTIGLKDTQKSINYLSKECNRLLRTERPVNSEEKMAFDCNECDFATHDTDLMTEHKKRLHSRGQWRCSVDGCDACFGCLYRLKSHLKYHLELTQSQTTGRPTITADKTAPNVRQNHSIDTNNSFPLNTNSIIVCKKCHKLLNNNELNKHLIQCGRREEYWKCRECEQSFGTAEDMVLHKYLVHKNRNAMSLLKTFDCSLCVFKGKTAESLRQHKQTVHELSCETANAANPCPTVPTLLFLNNSMINTNSNTQWLDFATASTSVMGTKITKTNSNTNPNNSVMNNLFSANTSTTVPTLLLLNNQLINTTVATNTQNPNKNTIILPKTATNNTGFENQIFFVTNPHSSQSGVTQNTNQLIYTNNTSNTNY